MIQTIEETPTTRAPSPERPTTRHRGILEIAARLICERGYEGASMQQIADPLERLRTCMEKNVLLVTRDRNKEITIILHEHATLTGDELARINARKKRYVRFLERSFAEAVEAGKIRPVDPKVAAFTFLGAVNWIYKWFRADGQVPEEELVRGMQEIFFGGLEPSPTEGPGGMAAAKGPAAP